jgi:uncharacterized membrane protein YhaH (DUF805 family)
VIAGVALGAFMVVGLLGAMLRVLWILGLPLLIGVIWASTSIAARRLHDRGKSAWWLLLYQGVPLVLDLLRLGMMRDPATSGAAAGLGFIGFCIAMWVLVDLGFLRGKPGANRFGDDPLQPQQLQEVFA